MVRSKSPVPSGRSREINTRVPERAYLHTLDSIFSIIRWVQAPSARTLTGVSGSSQVYKGGIISYCNEIKNKLLGVSESDLQTYGAVSGPIAIQMAKGARTALHTDIAVSVTGLAGPGADEYGNPVGTVFVGFADEKNAFSKEFHFSGDRETVRNQAICESLRIILENA